MNIDQTEHVTESFLCKDRGITRIKLRELRDKAQEGIHWYRLEDIKTKRGAVCWTEEGLEWLSGKLGDPKEKVSEANGDEVYGIVSQKPRNQKLLVCEIRGRGEKVLVRNQKNFKIGMLVPVKQVSGGIYVAAKHPDYRGRFL